MSPEQAKQSIMDKVSVTNQMVIYAKAYFLKNFRSNTESLIRSLINDVDAKKPDIVVIHQSVNTEEMLSKTAKYFSWRMAACEAIWGLIANNIFIPGADNHFNESNSVGWTTVVRGSGGRSAGWEFSQFSIPVPTKIIQRPSGLNLSDRPLSDPDLYMHELGIDIIGKDIEDSIREAVICFKNELYLACLALLGRASEGVWIELGLALARVIYNKDTAKSAKLQKIMEDQFIGIGKKIGEVLKAYEWREVFNKHYKSSGYKASDLKSIVVWADAVRESRNSIHYGAKPAMSNSYEKVAALLIGTVPNLKVIYSIINACNSSAT